MDLWHWSSYIIIRLREKKRKQLEYVKKRAKFEPTATT